MGLVEFTDLVYEHGAAYLKQATVRAVSTGHRLEVAVSFLRMMAPMDEAQRSVVEPQRALRLMQISPELQDQIELEVDESEPGKMYVDAAGREALRKLIRQLLEKAARENAEDAPDEKAADWDNQDMPGATWGHRAEAPLLRRIRDLKRGRKRIEIRELWDEEKQEYCTDIGRQGRCNPEGNAREARQAAGGTAGFDGRRGPFTEMVSRI